MYRMTQPLFLGGLIRYFTPKSSTTYSAASGFAASLVVCTFLNAFISHAYNLSAFHVGMKMRVGLCSLIYRKVRNTKYKERLIFL
jgi:ATP-binding cassette subfamily C (CFTR/MRP) protein 4